MHKANIILPDLVMLANKAGNKAGFLSIDAQELAGINDRQQLAELEAVIQVKLRKKAMMAGVSMLAPDTVYLSSDTEFGRDIVIEPHVVIGAGCSIGDGCHIKAFSHLEGAAIGSDCIIGPHARLRPGTILETGVKIGNFVETKNAHFETGAKANHLSYLGDATIGTDANIGAGVITCNYDGFNKSKTDIGANAFIGSNSALIAPVKIGDYAIIGAGSVIADTVDAHALSLTRAPQKTLAKGADKFRVRAKSKQGNKAK
jgi:bifunctional UDP-N-acetylglucosamine pyrophosphorylase/glucosamine-1-phosphate N-acetyltransferase